MRKSAVGWITVVEVQNDIKAHEADQAQMMRGLKE